MKRMIESEDIRQIPKEELKFIPIYTLFAEKVTSSNEKMTYVTHTEGYANSAHFSVHNLYKQISTIKF